MPWKKFIQVGLFELKHCRVAKIQYCFTQIGFLHLFPFGFKRKTLLGLENFAGLIILFSKGSTVKRVERLTSREH